MGQLFGCVIAPSTGFEPTLREPESLVLSTTLRGHKNTASLLYAMNKTNCKSKHV